MFGGIGGRISIAGWDRWVSVSHPARERRDTEEKLGRSMAIKPPATRSKQLVISCHFHTILYCATALLVLRGRIKLIYVPLGSHSDVDCLAT